MIKYVAFLRAINVGGNHIIKMEVLREMFATLGLSHIKTYIQSGNVIFETNETDMLLLRDQIERYLHQSLGYEVATFIRSMNDLVVLVNDNPFQAYLMEDKVKLYVTFLAREPSPERAQTLLVLSNEVEIFLLRQHELLTVCRPSDQKARFSNAFIEKQLAMLGTTRNWATVTKVATNY